MTTEEIRARWAKTTPAPWLALSEGVYTGDLRRQIATGGDTAANDLAAIASAPDDVAFLLDALDRLEAEHHAMWKAIERYGVTADQVDYDDEGRALWRYVLGEGSGALQSVVHFRSPAQALDAALGVLLGGIEGLPPVVGVPAWGG